MDLGASTIKVDPLSVQISVLDENTKPLMPSLIDKNGHVVEEGGRTVTVTLVRVDVSSEQLAAATTTAGQGKKRCRHPLCSG